MIRLGLMWVGLAAGLMVSHEARGADELMVVAHRGVVTETIPENSMASLEETIRRGYTHIEVDLRMTKDGEIVMLHDPNLERTTGVDQDIAEVTLAELHELVAPELVPTLEMVCEAAADRIEFMPDIKEIPRGKEKIFAGKLEALLSHYGLLENALFIGNPRIHEFMGGRTRMSTRESVERITRHIAEDPNYVDTHFVFGHAVDFDQERVTGLQALGLEVVVSINTQHYRDVDPIEQGLKDVKAMIALGVDGIQIDSVYESALRK